PRCGAGAGVYVTGADEASSEPFSVAVTESTPTTFGDVSVAVYVPSPLSVVAPTDPPVAETTTVPPVDPSGLPKPSLSWTVIVVAFPPTCRLGWPAVTVDVVVDAE